jgi:thioredoxin
MKIIDSDIPVVVDFWAEWCGPCNAMRSLLEEIAKEFEGKIKVISVNVEKDPKIAAEHSISVIPAFLFYKDGKVAKTLVGAQAKNKLRKTIEEILK